MRLWRDGSSEEALTGTLRIESMQSVQSVICDWHKPHSKPAGGMPVVLHSGSKQSAKLHGHDVETSTAVYILLTAHDICMKEHDCSNNVNVEAS